MGFPKMILLLVAAILAQVVAAGYTLTDSFTSANFISEFTHFTDDDPTRGFVQYVDHTTAVTNGFMRMDPKSIYLGVDHSNKVTTPGRSSIRVESKKAYNHGLFIADIAHMPPGICGVWPAFWLLGPNWPKSGEIDIVEGVNTETRNSMTLHTSADCSVSRTGFSGEQLTSNCWDTSSNHLGCGTMLHDTESYGAGFNGIGGGIYATEWTATAIKIWFFPRSEIPLDIVSETPDPSKWGIPSAQFAGECDMNTHFQNMRIVINTTFCGAWAGAVWNKGCADRAMTCEEFVANNPKEFADAYWSINSINVYHATVENHRHHGVRNEQRN